MRLKFLKKICDLNAAFLAIDSYMLTEEDPNNMFTMIHHVTYKVLIVLYNGHL